MQFYLNIKNVTSYSWIYEKRCRKMIQWIPPHQSPLVREDSSTIPSGFKNSMLRWICQTGGWKTSQSTEIEEFFTMPLQSVGIPFDKPLQLQFNTSIKQEVLTLKYKRSSQFINHQKH